MFFKVVALTLVLLVQITYQDKTVSRIHSVNNLIDNSGQDNGDARQFDFITKWFVNEQRYQDSQPKSGFLEVLNTINHKPDYGLKYTDDDEPQRLKLASFPGFHNLIEVRAPMRYRYIPKKLKEFFMRSAHKQNQNKTKPSYQVSSELTLLKQKPNHKEDVDCSNLIEVRAPTRYRYNIPKKLKEFFMRSAHKENKNKTKPTYQVSSELTSLKQKPNHQEDVDFSKERLLIRDDSHESYKRTRFANLQKHKEPSIPMQKFSKHQYSNEVSTAGYISGVSYVAPDVFDKIDPLPYKQVQTRNQEPDSDEDEEEDRTKYLEDYYI